MITVELDNAVGYGDRVSGGGGGMSGGGDSRAIGEMLSGEGEPAGTAYWDWGVTGEEGLLG